MKLMSFCQPRFILHRLGKQQKGAVLTKDEEIAKYSKRNGEMSFLFRYFVYDYLKFNNYGKRKEKHKATKHEADGREIG